MKKTKIYTRSGDKGETSLFTGQRVPKNDPFMEALGAVDECNSAIGLAISHLPDKEKSREVKEQLEIIQHALFDLGAAIATPISSASRSKIQKTRFDKEETASLETWIDEADHELPPLKTFILPGGHPAGAALHLARSICRRAERSLLPINDREDVSDAIMIYLNRLSDYLFITSRKINHLMQAPETLWEHHKLAPPRPHAS